MTKKDYIAIAALINADKAGKSALEQLAIETLSEGLADYFGQENPRFDRDRFLIAAGVKRS